MCCCCCAGAAAAAKLGKPVEGCWFCLSNPSADVELVASVGEECYVALDKGAITGEEGWGRGLWAPEGLVWAWEGCYVALDKGAITAEGWVRGWRFGTALATAQDLPFVTC